MSFVQTLTTVFISFLLVNYCSATYSPGSRSNVAVYWGQGPGQLSLSHFCQQPTIDIIIIAFVNVFPAQGNGYPGDNFGNQCWGPPYVYHGPGNNPSQNQLQSQCPQMVADIPGCQTTYGKKIILSLGGGSNTYQLTGAANGVAFADFLWGAFGPQNSTWIASGLPRPFDGTSGKAVEVDGFDFDIEYASTDNSAGYIAMINRLRSHFAGTAKQYLITGAPQCVVPDANMGSMIAKTQFDIIWIQFYNTPQCSASNWANANPNYASSHKEVSSGFSYNTWAKALVGTASANAKLWIGLSASTSATADPSFYLTPAQVSNLAAAYYCKPNFGGIMMWDATYAENNVISGSKYYQIVKNILLADSQNPSLACNSILTTSVSRTTSKTTTRTSTTFGTVTSKRVSTSSTSSTARSSLVKSSIKSSITTTVTRKSSTTRSPLVTSSIKSSKATTITPKSSTTRPSLATSSRKSSTTTTITPKSSTTRSSSVTRSIKSSITTTVTPKSSTTTKHSSSSSISSKIMCTPITRTSSSTLRILKTSSSTKTSTTAKTTANVSKTSSKTTRSTSITSNRTVQTYPPAPAGACGPTYMVSCAAGYCCSKYGYCGIGAAWCGTGCQRGFGTCS